MYSGITVEAISPVTSSCHLSLMPLKCKELNYEFWSNHLHLDLYCYVYSTDLD